MAGTADTYSYKRSNDWVEVGKVRNAVHDIRGMLRRRRGITSVHPLFNTETVYLWVRRTALPRFHCRSAGASSEAGSRDIIPEQYGPAVHHASVDRKIWSVIGVRTTSESDALTAVFILRRPRCTSSCLSDVEV